MSILLFSIPNSQYASINSSPLFIIVAESMVILRPIDQLGWLLASSIVIALKELKSRSLKGPPEPVSNILLIPAFSNSPYW